jgi:hypothetical protein
VHALTPNLLADPLSLLVDDALVASWIRQGLPSDPTSVQNGTILVNSERWPLMMDPQLQGVLWIKEREAKNGLQVGAPLTIRGPAVGLLAIKRPLCLQAWWAGECAELNPNPGCRRIYHIRAMVSH